MSAAFHSGYLKHWRVKPPRFKADSETGKTECVEESMVQIVLTIPTNSELVSQLTGITSNGEPCRLAIEPVQLKLALDH